MATINFSGLTDIKFNGTWLTQVIYNGTTVWAKIKDAVVNGILQDANATGQTTHTGSGIGVQSAGNQKAMGGYGISFNTNQAESGSATATIWMTVSGLRKLTVEAVAYSPDGRFSSSLTVRDGVGNVIPLTTGASGNLNSGTNCHTFRTWTYNISGKDNISVQLWGNWGGKPVANLYVGFKTIRAE